MEEINSERKVTLGCGTLILIALIVIIFSRGRSEDLEVRLRETAGDLQALERVIASQGSRIDELRAALDRQTQEIRSLREALEK